MLVGEAPGATEDRTGIPFMGAAGKYLDQLLLGAGLDRSSVWITNVVKCRPPLNRDPEEGEIDTCTAHYLQVEVETIDPQVIVAIGRFASAYFLPGTTFSEEHGKPRKVGERVVLPVYHPASALHNGAVRHIVEADFGAIPAALALSSSRPIVIVDGIAPPDGLIALDTEANIKDGKLVAVSTSKDGEISYVQKS